MANAKAFAVGASSVDRDAEDMIAPVEVGQATEIVSPLGAQLFIGRHGPDEYEVIFKGSSIRGTRELAVGALASFLRMETLLCTVAQALGVMPAHARPAPAPAGLLN